MKNCIIEVYDEFNFDLNNENLNNIEVESLGQNFEYKDIHKFKIPFKNSVTSINSEVSQQSGFKTQELLTRNIQYNSSEDRAVIGTHYHKALELIDLTSDYVKNTDFEDVDYSKIELAHKALKEIAKGCVNINKEAEFMMYVPYNSIVKGGIEDKVLIQGVVDLIIEKENSVIIVDYKFSKLKADVLKEKYAEQLKLYKQAVELAYNKPVESTLIYSINSGELV